MQLLQLSPQEGYHWFVGLQVEYPLGNRLARHQLKQRNLELKQAAFDQRLLTLRIATDVHQAIRDIRSSSERVTLTQATAQISER